VCARVMSGRVSPTASGVPPSPWPVDRVWEPGSFMYVGSKSGGDGKYLGNFALAPFQLDGALWASSEQAYQALQKFHPQCHARFQVGGDLGCFRGIPLVYPTKQAEAKLKWWSGMKPPMVGIVAKRASHPKRAKKLGLRMLPLDPTLSEETRIEEIRRLFKRILVAKYTANAEHRRALLDSGDKLIVEFDGMAEYSTSKGSPPLWTGMISKSSGRLFGKNLMGELLMEVRAELRGPSGE
jgi:predicted NAD-dependent protein-ADP-ribosyltransferase YbiA (DUF1768 family)